MARVFAGLGARPAIGCDAFAAGCDAFAAGRPLPGMAILDLESGPPVEVVRGALAGAELVALAHARAVDGLIPALTAGCSDYLFFPVHAEEARLLWVRHRAGGPPPVLPLEASIEGRFRLELPSDARCLRAAVDYIVATSARAAELRPEGAFRFRVALSEAVSNAILYGNREDPCRRVRLVGRVEPGVVRVTVMDEGRGFNPASVPDPAAAENLDRPSGRGLLLMRRMADEVRHGGRGSEVTLEVRAHAPTA